jgi:hypothetical protein
MARRHAGADGSGDRGCRCGAGSRRRGLQAERLDMIALQQKKGDVIETGTPVSMAAQKDGTAKGLVDVGEATTLHGYLDPAHRADGTKIVAQFSKEPEADFTDWLFAKNDYYRGPNARPNLAALQSNSKTQKEAGLLNIDIDVAKYADLSLVDDTAKRRHL